MSAFERSCDLDELILMNGSVIYILICFKGWMNHLLLERNVYHLIINIASLGDLNYGVTVRLCLISWHWNSARFRRERAESIN